MGYQTGDGIPDREGIPVSGRVQDKGWVPDSDGVSVMGWDTRHRWGSRQVMGYQMQVGFQTWDDGVSDRG